MVDWSIFWQVHFIWKVVTVEGENWEGVMENQIWKRNTELYWKCISRLLPSQSLFCRFRHHVEICNPKVKKPVLDDSDKTFCSSRPPSHQPASSSTPPLHIHPLLIVFTPIWRSAAHSQFTIFLFVQICPQSIPSKSHWKYTLHIIILCRSLVPKAINVNKQSPLYQPSPNNNPH